jgi:anti-anti-sigma factor
MAPRRFFLRGDIDIATAPDLQRALDEWIHAATSDDTLILDCCGLTFLDSSAVAVILHTQRLLTQEGRELRIVNADRAAARVLDVLGLTAMFHVNERSTASSARD